MQVRLTLLPSLMEISEEISTILGDTVETIQVEGKLKSCLNISLSSSSGSWRNKPGMAILGLQSRGGIRGITLHVKETSHLDFSFYFLLRTRNFRGSERDGSTAAPQELV